MERIIKAPSITKKVESLLVKKTGSVSKLHDYTYKIYSAYGYIKAKNMTNAICKAVKKHYGKESKETLIRFDILVKKGKHEVY